MFLLTCHGCSYTDDRLKLDDLGLEFITDPANVHLFPVLEDPEIPEPEPEPEPKPEPAPQPKPAKKRKSTFFLKREVAMQLPHVKRRKSQNWYETLILCLEFAPNDTLKLYQN